MERKPDWLKIKLPEGTDYQRMNGLIKSHGLHTICSSGKCPNMGECWKNGTATFMIMGDICTRNCRFCNTKSGKPLPLNEMEPEQLAESIAILELKHAVITSVDRDDLPDQGAAHWAKTISTVKERNPNITLEVLIPDFQYITALIDIVIGAKPEIISHNIETVRRLTPEIRRAAKYDRSLDVLRYITKSDSVTKSGFMVGLGETDQEVFETIDDIVTTGCEILTIGQYLQPTKLHAKVERYVTPETFESYKSYGLKAGLRIVESEPLVRSSYHAENHIKK